MYQSELKTFFLLSLLQNYFKMLTLETNDARLEQKISEKARAIGKSVQELLKDFVVEKFQEEEKLETLPFDVPKLDYRKYIKIIDNHELTDEDLLHSDDSNVSPFAHVTDTVEYARQLRKTAWERT